MDQLEVLTFAAEQTEEERANLAGGVMKGIYSLDGGHLTYCVALPGKPRPTEFATPPGSRYTLVKLERFTTGEQETEKALKAAGARVSHDAIGWVTHVTFRGEQGANDVARLASQLNRLRTLYIESDSLTDQGVANLDSMTYLQSLQLRSSQITDAGLAPLRKLNSMASLMLHGEKITDATLDHIGGLDKIYNLRLGDCKITDQGLQRIVPLQQLSSLQLDGTLVTDSGLTTLRQIPGLNDVHLSNTAVSDEGLAVLAQLPKLQSVSVADTRVTDAGIAHLANCAELRNLNVANTDITDRGMAHLRNAGEMYRLNLNGTQITDRTVEMIYESYPNLWELRIRGVENLSDETAFKLTRIEKLTWLWIHPGQFENATLLKMQVQLTNLRVQQR